MTRLLNTITIPFLIQVLTCNTLFAAIAITAAAHHSTRTLTVTP